MTSKITLQKRKNGVKIRLHFEKKNRIFVYKMNDYQRWITGVSFTTRSFVKTIQTLDKS